MQLKKNEGIFFLPLSTKYFMVIATWKHEHRAKKLNKPNFVLYSCWFLHEKIVYLLTSVQFYNYKQMLRLFTVAKILTYRLAGFDINGCPIARGKWNASSGK
jgi:hypothetical protein